MDEYLNSSWEEFEVWIRRTIGSDFRRKIRSLDNSSNRKMIAGLDQDALKRNNGVFATLATTSEAEQRPM